jgi:5S rRNA maturation endonuclease (ribonuclease M5)
MADTNHNPLDLKQHIDLREVIQKFWGTPYRTQSTYDVHYSRWRDDGRNPSFTVYADHFYDYGRGESGDIFDFLQQEQALTFPEAIHRVAEMVGAAGVSTSNFVHHPTRQTDKAPSLAWQHFAAAERDRAMQYLWSGKPDAESVLNYLRIKRGLKDDTIRRWKLGYNPRRRKTEFRHPETGNRIWVAAGITIPIFSDGGLWALRIRCRVGNLAEWLDTVEEKRRDDKPLPKYLSVSGSKLSGSLFNGDEIDAAKPILVVEGEFDAMLAQQELGEHITVITLGSATNHLAHRWHSRLADASVIYLALDADEAGQTAARNLLDRFSSRCQILPLPAGKDITDYHVQYDGDVRAWYCSATSRAPFPNGLPDSWRTAIMTYLPVAAAPLLELINKAIHDALLNPSDFTANQIIKVNDKLGFGMKRATIRRTLNSLINLFFSKLPTEDIEDSVCKTEKKSAQKGRKPDHYRLLPLDEIRAILLYQGRIKLYEKYHPIDEHPVLASPTPAMVTSMGYGNKEATTITMNLDDAFKPAYKAQNQKQIRAGQQADRAYKELVDSLENLLSTPLPQGWSFDQTSSYRATFLRARYEDDPNASRSGRQIANLLGISRRSVGDALKRAGLENVPQPLQECVIAKAQDVEGQIKRQARHLKGFPKIIVVQTDFGKAKYPYVPDQAQTLVETYLKEGAKVRVLFQVANKQRVIRDTPPTRGGMGFKQLGSGMGHVVPPKKEKVTRWQFGYSSEWLLGQVKLAFRLLEWPSLHGNVVDPETGEVLPDDLTQLIALLTGKQLSVPVEMLTTPSNLEQPELLSSAELHPEESCTEHILTSAP